jgi:tetratricopeptide (TPR) repeat protein
MIKKSFRFFSLFLLSSLLFVSCKTQKGSTSATQNNKSTQAKATLNEEQYNNLIYNFYNANKEKMLGNDAKAMDLFATCLRIDPTNDAAMYELALLYSAKKKYNDALNYARNASEKNPKNPWYKLLLAEIYERTGKWNDANLIYEELVKEYPQKIEYYYEWAQSLLLAGKPAEAIKIYDKMEGEIGLDKELIVQKERLYLKLNKVDKAAAELEKYLVKFPADMEIYSLLYDVYQVNNMSDKALEVIERMKKVNPNEPRIYLNLADYYRTKGDKEKSFENLKLAFSNKELESDLKIKIISSYLPLVQRDSTMLQQSMELSKILSETHPAEADCQGIYGDFLTMDKKYSEAVTQYKKSIQLDNKNLNVWQQLLINESELKLYDDMIADGKKAMELFPNESSLYLLTGIAQSQTNKTDDAVKTYLQGVKLVVDNDAQLVQFYSNLGDSYNKLKNYQESDKYFDKALVIQPREAFILNNYAYYLSLRKEKLDKAESMSKLSNEIMPSQSSFLDTYAWIFYVEGKYTEAKEWILKAMDAGGDKSGTIVEHYGDILYKLNDSDGALLQWQKAKQIGGASELLDKKINDRKLYE